MKFHFLIYGLLLVYGKVPAQVVDISVQKERVIFYDWKPAQANASIYLLSDTHKKDDGIQIKETFYKEKGNLVFIPELPLLHNVTYVIESNHFHKSFSLSHGITEEPTVTAIYPTSNKLPENLLRMYIQFSQPMKTIDNLKKIKLLDENGQEVKGAIFNNVYELWDGSQTQLTIIFDPARVKTGLNANKNLGRALQPNRSYKIVITNLEDIYGNKLKAPYIKSFEVVAQDIIPPNVNQWNIKVALSKSRKPLIIHFPYMLDLMSLKTRIQVLSQDETPVSGQVYIENEEKTWKFVPKEPWSKGNYTILVNSRLADPSGNNINGLFDHKIGSLKNKEEGLFLKIPISILH